MAWGTYLLLEAWSYAWERVVLLEAGPIPVNTTGKTGGRTRKGAGIPVCPGEAG